MPCYLFTFHGHATWMPDHKRGYVHRIDGLQPSDPEMAEAYRLKQTAPAVTFTEVMQGKIVETARESGRFISATIHAVFLEPTHVHVLMSWQHDRAWKSMRTSVRSAMSRMLNEEFGKRDWFSDTPSRKRVKDRGHFDHLVTSYQAKHKGAKWVREEDVRRARRP